jgi:hypothetical protein
LFLQTEELAILLNVQEEQFSSLMVPADNASLTQSPTPAEETVLLIPATQIPRAHQMEAARHAQPIIKLLLMEDSVNLRLQHHAHHHQRPPQIKRHVATLREE